MLLDVADVLRQCGVVAERVVAIGENHPEANANWHVWPCSGSRCVLRAYPRGLSQAAVEYEHHVLRVLADAGWAVPDPLGTLVEHDGRWWCLTRHIPGTSRAQETPAQRQQRGIGLARLNVSLRPLTEILGQRPGWWPAHSDRWLTDGLSWDSGLNALSTTHPWLADWAAAAAHDVAAELAAIGADELPLTVVHGDFAEWNVHYDDDQLAGVLDFGLTHLDTRPYELAIARTYRAPEVRNAYCNELARLDWPLSELEEAAIEPVYRAFRIGMVGFELHDGRRTGAFNLDMIESQLSRIGVSPPSPRPGSYG